jgi:lipoprotein-anchoring transpeptidase ErfK/SrfK
MGALVNDRGLGDAMKANGLSGWAVVASAAMVLAVRAMGQVEPTSAPQVALVPMQSVPVQSAPLVKRVIVVSLEDHKLALVEDGQVKKVYTVAVGKPSTPSPVGTYTIARRVKNPTYSHNGKVVAAGPGNPVGTRWMGLSVKGYGIHGTNEPKSIGKAASHGCIRMAQKDLEEMYELVGVGDTVDLVGQRNEETAQLFGGPKPAAAEQPVMVASATTAAAVTTASTTTEVAVNGVAVTGN